MPASRAARSVAAISDSGMPYRRSMSRRYSTAPLSAAAARAGLQRVAPHRLQLARRAGQHDDRRRLARAPASRRAPAPCRPAPGSRRPPGSTACLRLETRIASGSRSGQRDISGRRISRDAALQRLVEHHLAAWNSPDDRSREVVGGRAEPAARDDQPAALVGEEAQRPQDVLGTVADDRDRDRIGAEREQLLGQPRPVAVRHAPGQHLGAGDDDAGANAHRAALTCRPGACLRDSGWRPRSGVISHADRVLRRRDGAGTAVDPQAGRRCCRR